MNLAFERNPAFDRDPSRVETSGPLEDLKMCLFCATLISDAVQQVLFHPSNALSKVRS